jgi:hypothetical protein
MTKPQEGRELKLLSQPALLMTEAKADFDVLQAKFELEIKPRNIIESMYVADVVALMWDILRLRRCKAAIINMAFRQALKSLLSSNLDIDYQKAGRLASNWFTDLAARSQVSEILHKFNLDESSIEAEAIRRLSSDLEILDRMLAAAESRRNKALRCIEDYRAGFAKQVRDSADRVLQRNKAPILEYRAGKMSA